MKSFTIPSSFVWVILVCVSAPKVAGQGPAPAEGNFPSVNLVSPTASSLGKFVDFPANLHTGVPDINIPIYTVQEGPLQMPISLSYHASGLKVMEPASWVGAGWTLNAGGVVSRTVRSLPDEQVALSGFSFYSSGGFSNYFFHPSAVTGAPVVAYHLFDNGKKDGEPDLFTFNFGGHGGKFYFREDLTPVLIPEGDLKIEPIVKNEPNITWTYDYIQGFIITTPDGVRYHFGVTPQDGDVDPIEKSKLYTIRDLTYSDVISSWYLHKIESPDGEFDIKLTYRKEDYGYWTVGTTKSDTGYGTAEANKILMDGVAIEQIQFSNGTVDFVATVAREDLSNRDTSPLDAPNNSPSFPAKRLERIEIKSLQSMFCTSYNFNYDYYSDNSSQALPGVITQGTRVFETDRKRLKLNGLQKMACDQTLAEPAYQFFYFDDVPVPRRLSFAQDHWGFNNGVTSNSTMVPKISLNDGQTIDNPDGDDRSAKWPEMRAGALRLIQYPTGGSTEYIFEPNTTTVTPNCAVNVTSTTVASALAGLDGSEGFGSLQTFEVESPTTYYFQISLSSSITPAVVSGDLYIDNLIVASVGSNASTKGDYIFLSAGTHTIQSYVTRLDPNFTSGHGVISHVYTTDVSCNHSIEKLVGGLRVKQIIKSGGLQTSDLRMTYEYGSSNLYGIPTYVYKYKHPMLRGLDFHPSENGCSQTGPSTGIFRSNYGPVSAQPMQSVQGYHIGYSSVKEVFPDGGYTVSEYRGNLQLPGGWHAIEDVAVTTIDGSECTTRDPIFPAPPLSYDFGRGNLVSKKIYNSQGIMLKKITNTEQYVENPVGAFGLTTGIFYVNGGYVLPSHYELKSGKLLWSRQTETTYENGESLAVETITNYGSQFHRMPTGQTKSSQEGVSETRTRYISDITGCRYECLTAINDYLEEASILYSEYLAKVNSCSNGSCVPSSFVGWDGFESPCGTAQNPFNCWLASFNDFNHRLNEKRLIYYNQMVSCTQQKNDCISDGFNTFTNEEVKALFKLEEANQLHAVEVTNWKENILQAGTFRDHRPNSGNYSKIYLKNVYGLELGSPTGTFLNSYNNAGTITRDPKYNMQLPIASFVHKDGHPVEIKEKSGITTSYIWGLNNSVPLVKSIGADYITLQAAYSTYGSNLRDAPSLSGAQVSTYTYENTIVGISTVVDTNGRVLTYEYDKLGRLVRIKDNDGNVIEEYQYNYRID